MPHKHAALAAHVRRLCSCGADPCIVIPQVVSTLREIVGAEWGMFLFAGKDYQLCDVFSENSKVYQLFPIYFSKFHNNSKQKVLGGIDFVTAMHRGKAFENSAYFDRMLLNSEMYSELWRPLELRHSLEVTASDGIRGWGSVHLQRPPGSRPFSAEHHARIQIFSRHIAHALTVPVSTPEQFTEYGLSGVLVVDEKGVLLFGSADALKIVSLASGGPVEFRSRTQIPDWLVALVANFNRLWYGYAAPPCRLTRSNSAGLFQFRAYRFDVADRKHGRVAICIHAEHLLPLALHVEATGFRLGLSERQRQLCTDLLAGFSYKQVADRMCTKQSTVVDYTREIYRKLAIHNRDELKDRFGPRAIDGRSLY